KLAVMHTGGGGHRGSDRGELGPVSADSATGDSSTARSGLYGRDPELDALDALICHLTSSRGEATSSVGSASSAGSAGAVRPAGVRPSAPPALDADGMESV